MLNFSYRSKFFGQDVFHTPADKRRAYISTYQGLGFIQNGKLVIQSPVKKVTEYTPDFTTGAATKIALNDSLVLQAKAFYQSAVWLIKNKKYGQ